MSGRRSSMPSVTYQPTAGLVLDLRNHDVRQAPSLSIFVRSLVDISSPVAVRRWQMAGCRLYVRRSFPKKCEISYPEILDKEKEAEMCRFFVCMPAALSVIRCSFFLARRLHVFQRKDALKKDETVQKVTRPFVNECDKTSPQCTMDRFHGNYRKQRSAAACENDRCVLM